MPPATDPSAAERRPPRSAVVTGGTRGVGLAVARRLCARGYETLLVYGHSDADAKAAAESLAGLPGGAHPVRADLTEPGAMAAVLAQARERWGGLDVLVHNAAVWHPAPTGAARTADVRAELAMAVEPLLSVAGSLADLMGGREGRVVAVSSLGAQRVITRYAGLGLAKAALETLVRYLAVDLAPHGIAVNAVSTAKLDKGADTPAPQAAAALAARTPAGRLTTPDDLADVVGLLCRPEARWIHGQVLTADGGLSLLV